ncbi:MAG: NADP-dependent isocitrate dehydrogenase, partial [Acidobacteria bacterium]|nr:NADP-dependent isocitrate dehydrogenase [Acidobacteriota bacterium]
DIYTEEHSKQKVGTREFAQAVAARMGQLPEKLTPVTYQGAPKQTLASKTSTRPLEVKEMVGVDLFLDWTKGTANELGAQLEPLAGPEFKLNMISNRGVMVYPGGFPDTLTCDTWRCRFVGPNKEVISHAQIIALLGRFEKAGYDFVKFESLCNFDGKPGFSLGQGQ